MNSRIKHILGVFLTSAICLVIIDVVFQQSKILSGFYSTLHKEFGMIPRSDFNTYYFNEGFGVSYFDTEQFPIFNPNQSETWNIYGDSFIEAQQIFQRHHFASLLSKKRKVSIRNLGQSGMNFESMFSRYFASKDQFIAQKHIFFISSDDFDSDDIAHFLALPEFSTNDSLLAISNFNYENGIKERADRLLKNSGMYMLAKKDINQIRNKKVLNILFGKFSSWIAKKPAVNPHIESFNQKHITILLNRLKEEKDIVFVFRGQKMISKVYAKMFSDANIDILNLQGYLTAIEHKRNTNFRYHKVTKQTGHWNRAGHVAVFQILDHEL